MTKKFKQIMLESFNINKGQAEISEVDFSDIKNDLFDKMRESPNNDVFFFSIDFKCDEKGKKPYVKCGNMAHLTYANVIVEFNKTFKNDLSLLNNLGKAFIYAMVREPHMRDCYSNSVFSLRNCVGDIIHNFSIKGV